jgi:hypothetical protein
MIHDTTAQLERSELCSAGDVNYQHENGSHLPMLQLPYCNCRDAFNNNTTSALVSNNLDSFSLQTFLRTVATLRVVSAHPVAYRAAKQKIICHRRHCAALGQLVGHVPVCETAVQRVLRSAYVHIPLPEQPPKAR